MGPEPSERLSRLKGYGPEQGGLYIPADAAAAMMVRRLTLSLQ